MPGEDPTGKDRHLILIGQEPLSRVDDALLVVADLERDDRTDIHRNALSGDAGFCDLGLTHGQRQEAGLAEGGENEGAVAGDDPEWCRVSAMSAAGDQHGLIGLGHAVTEHRSSPKSY